MASPPTPTPTSPPGNLITHFHQYTAVTSLSDRTPAGQPVCGPGPRPGPGWGSEPSEHGASDPGVRSERPRSPALTGVSYGRRWRRPRRAAGLSARHRGSGTAPGQPGCAAY
eukprot:711472-Hanusia_phi.AAC.3